MRKMTLMVIIASLVLAALFLTSCDGDDLTDDYDQGLEDLYDYFQDQMDELQSVSSLTIM